MKVLGKISEIILNYQQPKQREDGSNYWGERYSIFIECGDDKFMADSGWLHPQGKDGGLEILKRRGIEKGAQGNATIRFGVREYNGKKYHEITLEKFDSLTKKEESAQASDQAPEPAPEAPTAESVQAVESPDTSLTF